MLIQRQGKLAVVRSIQWWRKHTSTEETLRKKAMKLVYHSMQREQATQCSSKPNSPSSLSGVANSLLNLFTSSNPKVSFVNDGPHGFIYVKEGSKKDIKLNGNSRLAEGIPTVHKTQVALSLCYDLMLLLLFKPKSPNYLSSHTYLLKPHSFLAVAAPHHPKNKSSQWLRPPMKKIQVMTRTASPSCWTSTQMLRMSISRLKIQVMTRAAKPIYWTSTQMARKNIFWTKSNGKEEHILEKVHEKLSTLMLWARNNSKRKYSCSSRQCQHSKYLFGFNDAIVYAVCFNQSSTLAHGYLASLHPSPCPLPASRYPTSWPHH
jgi:hypothetical protein